MKAEETALPAGESAVMEPGAPGRPALLDWPGLSADYARYHQTRGNQACHVIGIPLIMFAVVAWSKWPAGNPVPLAALLLPIYFFWDLRLAIGMSLAVAAMAAALPWLPRGGALAAFVIGWAFQFIGHKIYEKKSPAFFKNFTHLLVGPAWILQKALPGR